MANNTFPIIINFQPGNLLPQSLQCNLLLQIPGKLGCASTVREGVHCVPGMNMRLSKCSPWFGGHSVVKILAQYFECDDTPNPGSKKPSWSQLSDGVSCLSWWFIIFMAKNGFVSRNGKKGFFLAAVKLHCPTSENKFSNNLFCNGWMSMCSEMLGPSALQWFSPKKSLDLVFGSFWLFCSKQIV